MRLAPLPLLLTLPLLTTHAIQRFPRADNSLILLSLFSTTIRSFSAVATAFALAPSPPTPTATTEYWCWLSADCLGMYRKVQDCYNSIGGLIDPNDGTQAAAAQACLCDSGEVGKLEREKEFENCQGCFRGAKPRTGEGVLEEWESRVVGFCVTKEPSFYLFLAQMLKFMMQAHTPMPYTQAFTGPITDVTTLSDRFTPKSELNNLPLSTAAPTTAPNTPPPAPSLTPPADSNPATSAGTLIASSPSPSPAPTVPTAQSTASGQPVIVTATQTLRYNPSLLPSWAPDAWTAWMRPGRWAGQVQEPVTVRAEDGRPMVVVQGPEGGEWRGGKRSGGGRVRMW